MTGMTPERLDALRKRAEAATEGPWKASDFGHYGCGEPESIVVHTGEFDHSDLRTFESETAVAWMPRWEGQESDNATFIAHARTDVPELLDEVERLRDGIEGIKAKALDHQRIITEGPLVGRILVSHWCDKALLSPTEGETDG